MRASRDYSDRDIDTLGFSRHFGRARGRRSGAAAVLASYLGKGDRVDRALAKFAVAYADQTDHAALVKAVRSGRVEALSEE